MTDLDRIPLKEHIEALLKAQADLNDARFEGQEKAVRAALAASQEAITKLELSYTDRFKSVNEFRGTLEDQARRLITRDEVTAMFNGLIQRLDELKEASAKRDSEMKERLDKAEGKSTGLNAGWVLVSGAILVGIAIFGILT